MESSEDSSSEIEGSDMADARVGAGERRPSLVEALKSVHDSRNVPDKVKSPAKKKVKKKLRESKDKDSKSDEVKEELALVPEHAEGEEFTYNWPTCACGMNHPAVPHFTPPDRIRCSYYWQIADAFPFLSLHRTLTTEIKFIQADEDQSGLIELPELRGLLKDVFGTDGISDRMIEKTFKEIDTDSSGTIDFIEVLSIVYSLIQRDPNNLPSVVQKNYSKVCSIQ